ncbi:MAG: flavin reductase [Azonexus sp.]|jgi:3-hydroxy-9,10-secoandrosta-1,3,5(10)-triene-9,17-dione monooxygenase reductase component|nr:flavin reductase [Azonexus sp.]
MSIDPKQFRSALGTFATGVTIVTTCDSAGADVGLTVNSFSSVSLDPPMVLWSLAKKSHSRQAFIEASYFAVHILAADQSELATHFASPVDRFAGLALERGENGIPLLGNCAARFQCKMVSRYEGGDHDIFVGEVISYEHFERQALVFHAGRYAMAVEKPAASNPNTKSSDDLGRNSVTQLLAVAYYQLARAVRPEMARQHLSEAEYFILAAAALVGPCDIATVIDMIAVSGLEIGVKDIQRLEKQDLLVLSGSDDSNATIQLTDAGRARVLQIATAFKATESDAVTDFSYAEIEMLKQMLRRIIRRTRLPWQNDA